MVDRIQVDQLGLARAAAACRASGADAFTELTRLLSPLTRGAVEAAAGHDDMGQQIIQGWIDSKAESHHDFPKAVESYLVARGDHMSALGARAEATDNNAAQQVRAADIGLTQTAEGWSQATTNKA